MGAHQSPKTRLPNSPNNKYLNAPGKSYMFVWERRGRRAPVLQDTPPKQLKQQTSKPGRQNTPPNTAQTTHIPKRPGILHVIQNAPPKLPKQQTSKTGLRNTPPKQPDQETSRSARGSYTLVWECHGGRAPVPQKNQSILNASLKALNNSSGAPETMNLPRNSLNI